MKWKKKREYKKQQETQRKQTQNVHETGKNSLYYYFNSYGKYLNVKEGNNHKKVQNGNATN